MDSSNGVGVGGTDEHPGCLKSVAELVIKGISGSWVGFAVVSSEIGRDTVTVAVRGG